MLDTLFSLPRISLQRCDGPLLQAHEASSLLEQNLKEEQQITLNAWSCRQQLIATHRQVSFCSALPSVFLHEAMIMWTPTIPLVAALLILWSVLWLCTPEKGVCKFYRLHLPCDFSRTKRLVIDPLFQMQKALKMISSWPWYPDSLAIGNVIAKICGAPSAREVLGFSSVAPLQFDTSGS